MRKSSKLIAVAGVLAVTASAALAGTASAAQPVADGYVVNENALPPRTCGRTARPTRTTGRIGDGPSTAAEPDGRVARACCTTAGTAGQ